MLPPKILIILLVVFAGLGFMMYKRFKKQQAKMAEMTQMMQEKGREHNARAAREASADRERERRNREAADAEKRRMHRADQERARKEKEAKAAKEAAKNDFSNIDTKEGHPIVKAPTKAHYPHGNTWYSVRKGRAKTAEKCWKHARRNNIRGWGWRKHDKSCWHYIDPLLMTADTHPGTETNHLVGCNEPGQKVEDGCMDFDHGHTTWGHDRRKKRGLKPHQMWGGVGGHHHDKMSPDECRRKAKEAGFKATGYRTAFHPNNTWKNTCFTYGKKNSTKGFTGNGGDVAHITMCTDKTKRVADGC